MNVKGNNQSAGDGEVTDETASFFDDRAEEEARPVVPLRRDDDADTPTKVARRTRGVRLRGRMLALIVVAALAVGAVASYVSFKPEAAATSAEATSSAASGPTSSRPEPAASPLAPADASEISTGATRDAGRRASPDERVVLESSEPEEREGHGRHGRERGEDKFAERTRKEEERRREDDKKQAEREREEAKKRDERRRDEGKRDKPKARLVGTFTERPRP